MFNSFGPLSKAIEMAPPTQMTVPIILALLMKLRILTFSILINLETFFLKNVKASIVKYNKRGNIHYNV